MVVCWSLVATTYIVYIMLVLSKKIIEIQTTMQCGFILKHVCDIIKYSSQMHSRDKYSQQGSITWLVFLNVLVFV